MMYTKFDSYTYSRPVSYRSYNCRITKPEILIEKDPDTEEILKFFQHYNLQVDNLGGLSHGIRWNDLEVGKRKYNHNSNKCEYYIHQWKPTNDLQKEHPTGRNFVSKSLQGLISELDRVVINSNKSYK